MSKYSFSSFELWVGDECIGTVELRDFDAYTKVIDIEPEAVENLVKNETQVELKRNDVELKGCFYRQGPFLFFNTV